MSKKFGIVVILYNPEKNDIKNIIDTLLKFDRAYVYDNSDRQESETGDEIKKVNNCEYIRNAKNNGLAVCYNDAIMKASKDNIDYLCMFDQDSIVVGFTIEIIKKYIVNNKNKRIIAYAPYISYWGKSINNTVGKKVKWAINSGFALDVAMVRNIGIMYDENYFLDRLDRDFCKQIEKEGFLIYMVPDTLLWQQIGKLNKGRISHNYIRHYYIARNRLYYNNKFYVGAEKHIRNCIETIIHIFRVLVIERRNSHIKLKMIRCGINDYREGKMGKYYE